MLNPDSKCNRLKQTAKSFLARKSGKKAIMLAAMLVITVSCVATAMASTKEVEINYNGGTYTLQCTSAETENILRQARAQYPSLQVGDDDKITRLEDKDAKILLSVESAYDVTVKADNTTRTVRVYYGDTVSDALREANVTTGLNDLIRPSRQSPILKDGAEVTVTRRLSVSLKADGKTRNLLTAKAGTVEDALREAGITLGSEDTISRAYDDVLVDGMEIVISRVSYQTVKGEEEIPYQTVEKQDETMYQGQSRIEVAGVAGMQSVEKRQKLVDGQVAGETILNAVVTKEPVNEIKAVGVKKKSTSGATIGSDGTVLDQNGNPVNYSKVITGSCSAYTGGGTTATGKPAARGLVAVNPNIIPYGTKMYICSPDGKVVYGYAVAADTGGGVMDGRIVADLYYDSYKECFQIGRRPMNLYILNG